MAKAERFEDLIVWQQARALRKEIYATSKTGPFSRDYEMRAQIRSAALSAMDNVAEGFERGSNREFVQFLNIAKGSVGEVRSALWAALDEEYLTMMEFEKLRDHALYVSRLASKLITYLQGSTRRSPETAPSVPADSAI